MNHPSHPSHPSYATNTGCTTQGVYDAIDESIRARGATVYVDDSQAVRAILEEECERNDGDEFDGADCDGRPRGDHVGGSCICPQDHRVNLPILGAALLDSD
jgi:hypothetical protein